MIKTISIFLLSNAMLLASSPTPVVYSPHPHDGDFWWFGFGPLGALIYFTLYFSS